MSSVCSFFSSQKFHGIEKVQLAMNDLPQHCVVHHLPLVSAEKDRENGGIFPRWGRDKKISFPNRR